MLRTITVLPLVAASLLASGCLKGAFLGRAGECPEGHTRTHGGSLCVPATAESSKLGVTDCEDIDLAVVKAGTQVKMCDGTIGVGTLVVPEVPQPSESETAQTETVEDTHSFKDFMGAFTHHDKASAPAAGNQVSIASELALPLTTLPTGYREVPVITKDDYGTPTTASVNAVARNTNAEWNAGIPRLVCGKAAVSIASKIAACDSQHAASRPTWDLTSGDGKLMWEGAIQGNASEGSWTLVSVYHPSSSDGDTCDASCKEVWRDERTGYVWSDMINNGGTTTFNWCRASGSNNNDIAGNPYAEADVSSLCNNATYQVQTAGLPVSLCAEDAAYLDTPAYTNDAKGGMRLTGTDTAVRWKLPTVHDMSQAFIANGGYYVMPNMTTPSFWSSSVRSSSRNNAWYFFGSYGNINFNSRSLAYSVRCVGRP